MWPRVIATNLWSCAMRMANNVLNKTPSLQDKQQRTAQQMFSKTRANANPKCWKPFGCPAHVLDGKLQDGKMFHKWKIRSKVGVCLGKSPVHAKNVALILDQQTGKESPQFHATFDPDFASVKNNAFDSQWQFKAGFVKQARQESAAAKGNTAKTMAPSEGASAESMAPTKGTTKGCKCPRLDPLTKPSGSLTSNKGQETKCAWMSKKLIGSGRKPIKRTL